MPRAENGAAPRRERSGAVHDRHRLQAQRNGRTAGPVDARPGRTVNRNNAGSQPLNLSMNGQIDSTGTARARQTSNSWSHDFVWQKSQKYKCSCPSAVCNMSLDRTFTDSTHQLVMPAVSTAEVRSQHSPGRTGVASTVWSLPLDEHARKAETKAPVKYEG